MNEPTETKKFTYRDLVEILAAEFGDGEQGDAPDDSLFWLAGDADAGVCIHCRTVAYGVEPDGRRYKCEACGNPTVYGVEELVLRLCPA
jgi:hypothetical protein